MEVAVPACALAGWARAASSRSDRSSHNAAIDGSIAGGSCLRIDVWEMDRAWLGWKSTPRQLRLRRTYDPLVPSERNAIIMLEVLLEEEVIPQIPDECPSRRVRHAALVVLADEFHVILRHVLHAPPGCLLVVKHVMEIPGMFGELSQRGIDRVGIVPVGPDRSRARIRVQQPLGPLTLADRLEHDPLRSRAEDQSLDCGIVAKAVVTEGFVVVFVVALDLPIPTKSPNQHVSTRALRTEDERGTRLVWSLSQPQPQPLLSFPQSLSFREHESSSFAIGNAAPPISERPKRSSWWIIGSLQVQVSQGKWQSDVDFVDPEPACQGCEGGYYSVPASS